MQVLFMLYLFMSVIQDGKMDEREITFEVIVPDSIADNDTIFITGNVPSLGEWRPDAVPMTRIDTNKWQLKVNLPQHQTIEYKFTRGSWEREEVMSDGTVPGNKRFVVTKNQKIRHRIANWKDRMVKPFGGIVGKLEYHHQFKSTRLGNERTILVWLPESYATQVEKRYPVLYMHDGQNLFDPKTSFIGVDWQMDETADSLIRKGEIEAIIIVGIYNTPDRLQEYSDSEKGRAYMDFVVNEVKPFIDRSYRTLPDREHTAIMGSSMGGLISFYLVWRYPHIFSKAGCLSTSLLWRNGALLKEVENFTGPKPAIKIYLDSSGQGGEGRMTPDYLRLKELLIRKGFEDGKDVIYYFDPDGDHSERSWASRVWRPLKFLFGK